MIANEQWTVPPGFRFHPTEEELLYYYLRKKVSYEAIDLDVIREIDLNKLEPWDLKDKCRIGSGPQNEWYFFSHKDKKYPTGTRTNRATSAGFWKATGRDKAIHLTDSTRIGMRKTLVFYTGRAPHGQKTDWIMHEYRLDDELSDIQEDGWVVCRVFKKRVQNKGFVFEENDHEPFSHLNSNSFQMQYHPNLALQTHEYNYIDGAAAMHIPHLFNPEQPPTSFRSSLSNNLSNNSSGGVDSLHNFFMNWSSSSEPGIGDFSLFDKLLASSHHFIGQPQNKIHQFASSLHGPENIGASSQKLPFDVFDFSK